MTTMARQNHKREGSLIVHEGDGEKKGIPIILQWGNLEVYVRLEPDEFVQIAIEENGEVQSRRVPWLFRVNQGIAKWFGVQMGRPFNFFQILTKIECEHHHQHMTQTRIPLEKMNILSKNDVSSEQSVNS